MPSAPAIGYARELNIRIIIMPLSIAALRAMLLSSSALVSLILVRY